VVTQQIKEFARVCHLLSAANSNNNLRSCHQLRLWWWKKNFFGLPSG